MPEILETDICVIGAGSGGLSVAGGGAGFGVPGVLIEKGRMGGDCLNYGCVPSKALIAAARRAADFATSAEFGVSAGKPKVDFLPVRDHVRRVVAAIRPTDSRARLGGSGWRV